jgi:hypothetical protein
VPTSLLIATLKRISMMLIISMIFQEDKGALSPFRSHFGRVAMGNLNCPPRELLTGGGLRVRRRKTEEH